MRPYGPLDMYKYDMHVFSHLLQLLEEELSAKNQIKEISVTVQGCFVSLPSAWVAVHLAALMDSRVKRELVSLFFLYTL